VTLACLAIFAAVVVALVQQASESEMDRRYHRMRRDLRHSLMNRRAR
jgi:hypothetical protein